MYLKSVNSQLVDIVFSFRFFTIHKIITIYPLYPFFGYEPGCLKLHLRKIPLKILPFIVLNEKPVRTRIRENQTSISTYRSPTITRTDVKQTQCQPIPRTALRSPPCRVNSRMSYHTPNGQPKQRCTLQLCNCPALR